jgi:hypothetical protein
MDLMKIRYERVEINGLGYGQMAVSCEYCFEPVGSTKHGKILDS